MDACRHRAGKAAKGPSKAAISVARPSKHQVKIAFFTTVAPGPDRFILMPGGLSTSAPASNTRMPGDQSIGFFSQIITKIVFMNLPT